MLHSKPVDLQFAITRTNDITSMKHQSQQKAVDEQKFLAHVAEKQTKQLREKNTEIEQSKHHAIREDDEQKHQHKQRSHSGLKQKEETKQKEKSQQVANHPYKGQYIDLTL